MLRLLRRYWPVIPIAAVFAAGVFFEWKSANGPRQKTYTAAAQEGASPGSLEGVWKVTKVVQAGVTNTNPQPGLLIFSRGYYSATRVLGSEARKQSPAPKDPEKLTDAEKLARYDEWASYAASAGTYEVKGNTLITHNVVAKMVRGMTLTEEAVIQKIDSDSFVANPKPGNPNSDRQTTYTRVQ